jgi:hypothetical protein
VKKTRGRKSRDSVPLNGKFLWNISLIGQSHEKVSEIITLNVRLGPDKGSPTVNKKVCEIITLNVRLGPY